LKEATIATIFGNQHKTPTPIGTVFGVRALFLEFPSETEFPRFIRQHAHGAAVIVVVFEDARTRALAIQ